MLFAEMNPWPITICMMAGSSSRPLVASPDFATCLNFLFFFRTSLTVAPYYCPFSCCRGKNIPCQTLTIVILLLSNLYTILTLLVEEDTSLCDPSIHQGILRCGRRLGRSDQHRPNRIQVRQRNISTQDLLQPAQSGHQQINKAR